jgi:hypothetical protein
MLKLRTAVAKASIRTTDRRAVGSSSMGHRILGGEGEAARAGFAALAH